MWGNRFREGHPTNSDEVPNKDALVSAGIVDEEVTMNEDYEVNDDVSDGAFY